MIWLYWRRWRPVIAATSAVVGAIAALVVVADNLAGSSTGLAGAPAAAQGTAAPQPQVIMPSGTTQVRRGLLLMSLPPAPCRTVSSRSRHTPASSRPRHPTPDPLS